MKDSIFLAENPLKNRRDVIDSLMSMLTALDPFFDKKDSGILLGYTCAHYGPKIAEMEALSRILWGLFPLLSSGESTPFDDKYFKAIINGTNPDSDKYWGKTAPYDQKFVEMAVYGLGLCLLNDNLETYFNQKELQNLWRWLSQINDAQMPDSNWNYFAIMVQIGFKKNGLPYDNNIIDKYFSMMEAYYLGNGWYSDGIGRPKDYYISMAFHYYGLLYAKFMQDEDPDRAKILRERAICFSKDFIYMFDSNGAAIPFGRSLTYRFAEAAFWSVVVFAELDIFSLGEIKGIILRHLRWWFQQPIFDNAGILSIGYCYPNLIMAEDYNSPGSPYWAFKIFLILALPENHPFWQAKELPFQLSNKTHIIPESQQIIVHNEEVNHVYMLTSGQLELNNYVNTESKYTKFAYSSSFGWTCVRGRYGLKHASCDSMLLLSEKDNYYRGRRECSAVIIDENFIYSSWSPWSDVHVQTWLIPCGEWHIRVHKIDSQRELDSVEGGFAVMSSPETINHLDGQQSLVVANNGVSTVVNYPLISNRHADVIITPPNSSITFPECAAIPVLISELIKGQHWLCCAVAATRLKRAIFSSPPTINIDINASTIIIGKNEKQIPIKLN